MARGINLSPKFGVNPSLMLCWLCGESTGVALLGQLPGDKEAPRKAVFDQVPCAACQKIMESGVFLVEVANEAKEGDPNPPRTGCVCALRDEAIRRIFDEQAATDALKARVAYLATEAWDALGLPRGKEGEEGR